MPRPPLSVVGGCQAFTVGSEEVRVVGRAVTLVATCQNLAGAIVQAGVRIARPDFWFWSDTAAEGEDSGVDADKGCRVGEDGHRKFVDFQLVVAAAVAVDSFVQTLVDVDHQDLDSQ